MPPGLARALPPGSAVISTAALAATVTGDPLAAAPQQALLALAMAAALLAITGFWVSIAADVRQRRAENALLAALGVGRRSAAAQLFLEKLLLSVPSAAARPGARHSSWPGCSSPPSRSPRRRSSRSRRR